MYSYFCCSQNQHTAWNVSVFGVFLVRIQSECGEHWIRAFFTQCVLLVIVQFKIVFGKEIFGSRLLERLSWKAVLWFHQNLIYYLKPGVIFSCWLLPVAYPLRCYPLQIIHCSILTVKPLVTRCKNQSSGVAKITCYLL